MEASDLCCKRTWGSDSSSDTKLSSKSCGIVVVLVILTLIMNGT